MFLDPVFAGCKWFHPSRVVFNFLHVLNLLFKGFFIFPWQVVCYDRFRLGTHHGRSTYTCIYLFIYLHEQAWAYVCLSVCPSIHTRICSDLFIPTTLLGNIMSHPDILLAIQNSMSHPNARLLPLPALFAAAQSCSVADDRGQDLQEDSECWSNRLSYLDVHPHLVQVSGYKPWS